jgi:hypothetical protein
VAQGVRPEFKLQNCNKKENEAKFRTGKKVDIKATATAAGPRK